MIGHWAHAHLIEALGWGVVWAAVLFAAARYAEAGAAWLARRVRRAACVLAEYGRSRAAAMRRPGHAHRARRPHPRLAALLLAAHLHLTRFTNPGGTR